MGILDKFFFVIAIEKEFLKLNETINAVIPARKVLN